MKEYKLFINGQWQESADGIIADDVNPATGETFAKVHQATEKNIESALTAATEAGKDWRNTGPTTRERLLLKAAEIMDKRREEITNLLIEESGCVFGLGWHQVEFSIDFLRSAAGECRRINGDTIPSDVPGLMSITTRQPLGVIVGIAPFNAPFLLSSNKIDKALAAGNTFILKPSSETPISGLLLAEIYEEAGLPAGVLNVLPGSGSTVGPLLIKDPRTRMILFTGSTSTGKKIAVQAAEGLKKFHLEMGGKSPLIVLQDADLDYAVNTASFGIFSHQGQVCMASSRVIVEKPIYEEFCTKLAEKAASLKVGSPKDSDTIIGPLIRPEQCEFIDQQIKEATDKGARVLTGGSHDGPFYQPTVLVDVTPAMQIYDEESFGPVVCVICSEDSEQAMELANNSSFGLSAGVITNDLNKAMKLAHGIEAGMVHINATTMQCETNAPFGGVKDSGFGREGGRYSIDEMTELKWITIQEGQRQYPF